MVLIIDYNMGNLRSVEKAVQRLKYPSTISKNPSAIRDADKLILPGIGHFKQGMENLSRTGLIDVLNEQVLIKKKPILGICLGMHLFTQSSEEGNLEGLGWINGLTLKFSGRIDEHLKIPHMGWNNTSIIKESFLTKNIDEKCFFYFAHSYFVQMKTEKDILMKTVYGIEFVSSFASTNIVGTQFHPEKSHKCGFRILKNFLEN